MKDIIDLPHAILNTLYINYSLENFTLNQFFINDMKFDENNIHDAGLIKKALDELQYRGFIEYTENKNSEKYPTREETDKISSFGRKSNPYANAGILENTNIDARLLLNGYIYIANKKKDERQQQLIETQTKLTKTSTRLVLATVIISTITLVKEIWLSPPVIDKETKQLLQKQEKDLHSLQQSLQMIDSSYQKNVKISSSKVTPH